MIAMMIGVLGSIAVVIGAVMSVSSPDMLFDLPAVILVLVMALFSTLDPRLSMGSVVFTGAYMGSPCVYTTKTDYV